jgi:hypothetical protein
VPDCLGARMAYAPILGDLPDTRFDLCTVDEVAAATEGEPVDQELSGAARAGGGLSRASHRGDAGRGCRPGGDLSSEIGDRHRFALVLWRP